MLRFALTRAIEILGEAASKVSPDGRASIPDVPWVDVVGMRNRLIHAYVDVNSDTLWRTVDEAIPDLLARLKAGVAPGWSFMAAIDHEQPREHE